MTRIRFRTDSDSLADDAARHGRHQETLYYEITELAGVEAAQPGDCWRVRWHATGDETGPIAGYAICCPLCKTGSPVDLGAELRVQARPR
jgi:hypothetical protein